ncbi:MAG: OmpA family protein [Bacteroidales bacterium]|jgi:outer membrane protein OmpA-like peptidoglycan-associated protein/Tol biopolymer transport system component|nr:OmpA family protein [Bacteroidales bacterium]
MKKLIISACYIFLTISIVAQNVEFDKNNIDRKDLKDALSNIKIGDSFWVQGLGAYPSALEHYLKAQKINPNNALLNFKIGVCYRKINIEKSLEHLLKSEQLDNNCHDSLYYWLGYAYQRNYKFNEAINSFKNFKNKLTPKEYNAVAHELNKVIQECETGIELVANPTKVFIDNIGPDINTIYREYSPFINADESMMIFTSRRPNTTGGGIDPRDKMFYEDIYIASRGGDGSWKVENPGSPLNSKDHDATAGLSGDGQILFIYRAVNNGDVYQSVLKGTEWGKPVPLPKTINGKKSHESTVSLSPDGKSLYFISDREGSVGKRDIWVSHKDKKGNWGEAINVRSLNTIYNEESIFMHPDGKTLYFSSEGHKNMGGFDVFKSTFNNGKWSEPVNLGYPINTPDDDVFFTIAASGTHAYMMGDARADGYGERDIYVVTFILEKPVLTNTEDNLIAWRTEPVSETSMEAAVNTVSLTLLKGRVLDEATKEPVEASIILTDNVINEEIATFTSNSATGKYLVSLPSGKNYGIAVKAPGYLFHSENFDIPKTSAYQEVEKDIYLKKVEIGKEIVLKNIFFDFNKATLRPESKNELENLTQLMRKNPTIKIEISGHTDNVGSAAYNKTLSQARAKAVVDYLINAGIPADRMTSAGYGFDKPIASNETDAGRQLNRRTEFKITSK